VTSPASDGVSSPAATAAKSLEIAFGTSRALSILGRSSETSQSFRGGRSRSKQRRSAARSPPLASSTAFLVRVSASPSNNACVAISKTRYAQRRGQNALSDDVFTPDPRKDGEGLRDCRSRGVRGLEIARAAMSLARLWRDLKWATEPGRRLRRQFAWPLRKPRGSTALMV